MARLQPTGLALGAMHIPNQSTGRKPHFHNAVLALARRWRGGPAILAGDTNSGQIDLDEERPVFNRATDAWMRALGDAGWRDAFRQQHGYRREFTWYSPGHNNGFRLDQAFLNSDLAGNLAAVQHLWMQDPADKGPHRREALSDHAALLVDLEVPA